MFVLAISFGVSLIYVFLARKFTKQFIYLMGILKYVPSQLLQVTVTDKPQRHHRYWNSRLLFCERLLLCRHRISDLRSILRILLLDMEAENSICDGDVEDG